MSKKNKRTFVLYDGRACGGDTDDATVLVACRDNKEAELYKGDYGDMACFSYRHGKNQELVDERHEWNFKGG